MAPISTDDVGKGLIAISLIMGAFSWAFVNFRRGVSTERRSIEGQNLSDYKERTLLLEKDRDEKTTALAKAEQTITQQGKEIAHANGRIDELSKIPLGTIAQYLTFLAADHEKFAKHYGIELDRPAIIKPELK